MHCCYSRKKRARARERESVSREESINRNSTEDRYRNRVIRPSLSLRKKAKRKKSKNKAQTSNQTAKDDDDDVKTTRKRTLAERPAKDNCWCSNARKRVRTRWSASRPRVARAFSKSTKNFSYHQQEERGPPLVSSL